MAYILDYELLKIICPPIATVLSAGVIGGLGVLTAHAITRKIEQMKLDSQLSLELYKTLFNTRMEASNKLSETAGKLILKANDWVDSGNEDQLKVDIVALANELFGISITYSWILTGDVNKQVGEYNQRIRMHLKLTSREDKKKSLNDLYIIGGGLSKAINEMMHEGDLSGLVLNRTKRINKS